MSAFSQSIYSNKISPIAGVGWSQSFYGELGISTEFYRGRESWAFGPNRGGYAIKNYRAFGHSLNAEFHFANNNDNFIVPKYSVWFHSYKVWIFAVGTSVLYSGKDGICLRPEVGLILPKDKMDGLLEFQYLRLKLMYGYGLFLKNNTSKIQHNFCLHIYFGNNIGYYRATRYYRNPFG